LRLSHEHRLDCLEIETLTGYRVATKQLQVLHRRGFLRAYINRAGTVVVERTHCEAITLGEVHNAAKKTANLSFLKSAT
jgi:hypothetical protein